MLIERKEDRIKRKGKKKTKENQNYIVNIDT